MLEYRIMYRCELREDMHAGTGLGRLGLTDDVQARDARGLPVVWHSTFTGLLRDAADELTALGHPSATPERVRRLFGAEGENARSALVARSLHFERAGAAGKADLPALLTVTSTARAVHSRRPLDDTLRTIEMAAAGLVARAGELRLVGDTEDCRLVELCLRRLSSVGGGKTRGAGQVRMSDLTVSRAPALDAPPLPASAGRLRLLLRLMEPTCIPATGYPGNIIAAETFLPGQALRGAFLTALAALGVPEADVSRLAPADALQFGNGYFIPADLWPDGASAKVLRGLVSLPLPLTAEEAKPTERGHARTDIPWWASEVGPRTSWLADEQVERDKLCDALGAPAGARKAKFKRVKHEDHLVGPGDGSLWRDRPVTEVIMRNRTPVARQGRVADSRRQNATGDDLAKEVGRLFAQTVLAEDQLFVADIRVGSAVAAELLKQHAAALLGGNDPAKRAWLRLGRGGRPVRVEDWAWVADPAESPKWDGKVPFTLTLISDWIVRDDDLTFLTRLTGAALVRLAGVQVAAPPTVDEKESTLETRPVHGFNTAAGTRRSPAVALKRGSAFLVGRPDEDVRPVYEALAAREAKGQGVGERTEEGFGRFALNHAAHRRPAPGAKTSVPRAHRQDEEEAARLRRAAREGAIEKALATADAMSMAEWCRQRNFPSRGQWQQLRHQVEVVHALEDRARAQAKLDRLMGDLIERSGKLSGRTWASKGPGKDKSSGAPLKSLCNELDERRKTAGDVTAQATFLKYLARWVVVRLDRLREETKGDRQ